MEEDDYGCMIEPEILKLVLVELKVHMEKLCNWFQGLERFIDETDVDENAFAVLELRFGFTRTLKISWHNNYWCDPNLIEHNLKEVEGSQHGFYVNMVIKAFLFFPEELPNTAYIDFDDEDG
ncbi:hypothetical protein LguiB_005318 [Lonicera macranthoides]